MTLGPFYVNDKPPANVGIEVLLEGSTDEAPIDGSSAAATLTYPDGHTQSLDANVNDGTLVIEWPDSSPFSVSGAYVLQARLTTGSGSQTVSPIGFIVLDPIGVQNMWVNVGDVMRTTGKAVTPNVIIQAQTQIEVLTRVLSSQAYLYGTTPLTGQSMALSAGDSQMLRLAVAYQAAWVDAQPDLFDRHDVTSMSQDGVSANFTATGMTIAPLAKQCVRRLSWMGSGSVSLTPAGYVTDNRVEALDDALPWKTL